MMLNQELKKLSKECSEAASTFCEFDSLYNSGLWKLYKVWCADNCMKESDGYSPEAFIKKVKEYELTEDFKRILDRWA